MFGRPSQHLLPSHPPASARGSPVVPDPHTAPVAPLNFKDFRFNSIGKQPELLSRISLPQPDHTDYHSPTPSPTSSPLPTFTNNGAFQPQSSSRLTLFQQLAGSDSGTMNGGSRWHMSTSQSNGSLASRIQMNVTPSNDIPNTARGMTTGPSSPPMRINTSRRATEHASLIPPVEILPQLPDSSSPTPTSLAPTLEPMDVHSPASSILLMDTAMNMTSRVPTPTTTNVVSNEQTGPFSSFAVADAIMQNLGPSPSAVPAIDSLLGRQDRLQAISASLASLAALPPASSQSSSPDPSVTQSNDNITTHQSNQSQHSTTPIVLHQPYAANKSSTLVGSSISNVPTDTNDTSLALVPSPTTLTQEHQIQHRAFVGAVQNLNSALNALHRVQVESENAFTHQLRAFEERCAAFEETKRVDAAMLQQQSQELQQKREELNTREAYLALLEKESKAREDARKGMLARRQVQEEEKRATEAKRIQETQERIATAMKEVMEVEALTLGAKCQFGQLASETAPDDLPTEPQEGMNKEEMAAIKSRNDILSNIKHLRQLYMDGVQKLEESNRTLRRLEEEREKRQADEAEHRRIAEEERLRAHVEAEQVRKVQDKKWRQLEAERKHHAVENGREQARLLAEQQARAEPQARGSRRPEISSQTFEHRNYPEEVIGSQQQAIVDMTRIRTALKANSRSPPATNVTSVDADERASASHLTAPSPDIHTSPEGSQSTTSLSQKKKRDGRVSGGVMLAATKARGGHLPPKPLAEPPSRSSSDHVTKNAMNFPRTSPAFSSMSAEQLDVEFNRTVDALADMYSTPDHKSPFPRTPKSQTVLDATNRGSQELNIGPAPGVSPTQQNVNLRHLKRSRGRVEENDSGDRSVRTTNVKSEENSYPSLKREEDDNQSREPVLASPSIGPPASLPRRPAIIPPPRPWMSKKRHAAPATDSTSSYPPERNEVSSTREAEVTTDGQPREALSRGSISQAVDALPVPAETTNSLLLGPVHPERQSTESRINIGERPTQDCTENYDTTPSESATATLSHELDGEDPARNNRRFTDEHRRARNENSSRRLSDHYSPSLSAPRSTVVSPTQPHRLIDSWRLQNTSNGPRAEPMRATSPTTGRKRPSEFSDNEHGHRARRHRLGRQADVWIAQDQDPIRVDSYRPHWDRHLDSELDERRIAYRTPPSPLDRSRPYPSDIPRATYDNRTYVAPSEESTALPARLEQSYRRQENDDAYQRYHPPAPGYNAMADQHHTDDARVGQTYEPMFEERMDVQPDPPLLARMSTTQHFPVTIMRQCLKISFTDVWLVVFNQSPWTR